MLAMTDFPHVRDDRLRLVLAHWLDIRRGRLLPARADIDPGSIRSALPHVWLCDFDAATGSFHYRLAGEEVNSLYGVALVGRDLEETLPPDSAAEVLARYRRMRDEPTVIHMIGKIHLTDGRALDGERIVLPMGADGAHMDTLWGAVLCDWRAPGRGVFHGETLVRTMTPLNEPAG